MRGGRKHATGRATKGALKAAREDVVRDADAAAVEAAAGVVNAVNVRLRDSANALTPRAHP